MPLSSSKRDELAVRREIERNLFNIGLTFQDVATALGLDSSSVYNDFKQLGGRNSFTFPEMNASERRNIVYRLAFKTYARLATGSFPKTGEVAVEEGIRKALAAYIDVPRLQSIAEGVWSAIKLRIHPVDPEKYSGHRELLQAVFGKHRSNIFVFLSRQKKLGGEGLLEFFLRDVVTNEAAGGIAPPNRDTFGDTIAEWAEKGFTNDMCTPLTEPGARLIESVFSTISPKEEEVIRMTFGIGHNKLTVEECGQKLNYTRGSIRQVQAKALRKLRHPIRARTLQWVAGHPEDLSHGFIAAMAKERAPRKPKIVEVTYASGEKKEKNLEYILDTSVEELQISIRGYNCLKNANVETVRQLIQLSEDQYLRIRNTSRKTLNELKEILKDMGGLHFDMKFDGEGNLITPLLTREDPEESLW